MYYRVTLFDFICCMTLKQHAFMFNCLTWLPQFKTHYEDRRKSPSLVNISTVPFLNICNTSLFYASLLKLKLYYHRVNSAVEMMLKLSQICLRVTVAEILLFHKIIKPETHQM